MTDETPKPKRKRWRWIIAGVLLFVVGVGGWWYWPRVDARFVGKWHHSNPRNLPPTDFTLDFRSDGSGTIRALYIDLDDESEWITTPLRWWVRGNELRFALQTSPKPISRLACVRIVRVTDRQIFYQRCTDDFDSAHLVMNRIE